MSQIIGKADVYMGGKYIGELKTLEYTLEKMSHSFCLIAKQANSAIIQLDIFIRTYNINNTIPFFRR